MQSLPNLHAAAGSHPLALTSKFQYLRDWNHIHGPLPYEVIELPEGRDLPKPVLDGRVEVIANKVHREMAIANGDAIEIDGDNDDVDDDDVGSDKVPSRQELIELCRRIEAGCTHYINSLVIIAT